ncbi:hypothetical protein NKJ88_31300 [Mesorhizobium sp. M0016]|uniref:hypothetical protein n=1 Tax=Mesorhizobium sp. M0016 TaxID=2956843 RepID=UPI003335E712
MGFRRLIAGLVLVLSQSTISNADEFTAVTRPSFADVEPRLVYGLVSYDFAFAGKDGAARSQSASAFLQSLIKSRFQNKSGNYIVSLDVAIGDKMIATEPIMSATWESSKFLFITTSEKSNIVINRNGVLVDDIVVDSDTNRISISMKVRYSSNTSVDMSLLTELSQLAKTASLAGLSPGVQAVSEAYAPFATILTKILSKYTDVSIVDNTTGAFTLLDEGFANQLRYNGSNFKVNIYLKTLNSQLPTNFSPIGFKISNFSLPLTEVKSGVGAARAPVIDLIAAGTDRVGVFVKAIAEGSTIGSPKPASETEIRDSCASLRTRLNKFVTSRDAALLYWSFLRSFHTELSRYKDGAKCGRGDLVEDLAALNLQLGAEDWPAQ